MEAPIVFIIGMLIVECISVHLTCTIGSTATLQQLASGGSNGEESMQSADEDTGRVQQAIALLEQVCEFNIVIFDVIYFCLFCSY